MVKLLEGKIALVTGASRGIGRAIAQRLASAGATVVVSARSLESPSSGLRGGAEHRIAGTLLETVALIEQAGGRAFAIAADIEDDQDVLSLCGRAAEKTGGLDILVNNAGFADYVPFNEMSVETLDRTLQHYLRAPMMLSQSAVPILKSRGQGWIVNIGSVVALPPSRPYGASALRGVDVAYGAAKAGIQRFTMGLAATLLGDNIAVNLVAPSTAVRTPGADSLIPEGYPAEPVEYLAETVLAMCHKPAAERTGLTAFSIDFPLATGLVVHSLDGRALMPRPELSKYRHAFTPRHGDELYGDRPADKGAGA
jgi:3-oxoacyl-[acyl-carrier protein] reductase